MNILFVQTTKRIKYNGAYEGISPTWRIKWTPGEEKEVPINVADDLLKSGQFSEVIE